MRLQQQLDIVTKALAVMGSISWDARPNAQAASNKTAVTSALKELLDLPYVHERVAEMLRFHTFAVGGDEIVLDNASHNRWNTQFTQVVSTLNVAQKALQAAVPDVEGNSIAVRVPNTSSLSDVSEALSELESILRPVLDLKGTDVKIAVEGFDTGSMWVLIALGSAAALVVVRHICSAAKEILSLELEGARNRLSLKRMGVEEEVLETISVRVKQTRLLEVRKLARMISDEDYSDEDNERSARLEYSIDLLVKMNHLGGEIRPAIEPVNPLPQEEAFPDIQKVLSDGKRELEQLETKLLSSDSSAPEAKKE